MAIENSSILITGGSSGLGLEMAKRFMQQSNRVIICSRTPAKLQVAKQLIPGLEIFRCDISDAGERVRLKEWIAGNCPQLNVLINNAAIVHKADFFADSESCSKAAAEIATNLSAPIHLSHLLFPVLVKNEDARIINITTGLVYAPRVIYPFYNATKAALHSFTQVLRSQSKNKPIKIIEVMFPVVDTPWHHGKPPSIAISAEKAVSDMMKHLQKGKEEIRIAGVKILHLLCRIAPGFAFRKINSL